METMVKCQNCDREIQAAKIDLPCEYCGDRQKKYILTINEKLGWKVKITDKIQRAIFCGLSISIIIGVLIAFIITLFKKQLINYLPLWLVSNLTLWLIVFGIAIVIIAFLVAFPRMYAIGKLKRAETKFHWKSIDEWVRVIKPSLTLLLFSFISLYLILSIANPMEPQLNIDLIIISATLGGLVLTAASFLKGEQRIQLMSVARLLILSTILLIIFVVTYALLHSTTFDPSIFTPDSDWIVKEVVYLVFVVGGIFGGVYSFSKALLDLFDLIRKKSWTDT